MKTAQTVLCIVVNYVKIVSCVLTQKSVKHNIVKEKKCSERDTSQKRTRFCDITREHPSEILNIFNIRAKVSRDVIFTLQKKLFENDSDERL